MIFKVYRDYKKKNITPIKLLKPGQRVSIEGRARLMDHGGGIC